MDLTLFILFILSATGGHLGCVQNWTIIDKAGLYIHGHGCLLHYVQTFSSHSNKCRGVRVCLFRKKLPAPLCISGSKKGEFLVLHLFSII